MSPEVMGLVCIYEGHPVEVKVTEAKKVKNFYTFDRQ